MGVQYFPGFGLAYAAHEYEWYKIHIIVFILS